jgi:nitrogen regulatory protein PII 2
MKEVLAIVRMGKINLTKSALAAAGITSLHAKDCLGRGKGTIDIVRPNGIGDEYDALIDELGVKGRLVPKRMISIIVPDKLVKKVVETIIATNKTGRSGDGKIFVMPMMDSIRIRTGESGPDTLDQ